MANARAPAVMDLVDEGSRHLDRVNLGKQGPRAAQARQRGRGALAGPGLARSQEGAVIVLDDSAGSSDNDGVLDLAQDRGKAPMRTRQMKRSRAAALVDLTGGEDEAETATRAGRWLFAGVQRTDTAYDKRHVLSLEDDKNMVAQQAGPSRAASEERLDNSGDVAPSNNGRQGNAAGTLDAGPSEAWDCSQPIFVDSQQSLELVQELVAATFRCAVCYDDHAMEDCFIASMCRHRLCRDAAREVVLGAIKSCTFPILCPICQARADPPCAKCQRRRGDLERSAAAGDADDSQANGPASWCCSFDADITLLLSVEEEQEYLARSLKAATNSCADLVPCPQANCDGVAVSGGEDDSPQLVCNVCNHAWCKTCKVDWHTGVSCDEHLRQVGETEADKGLKEYQAKNRMISCPTCGHGIEKITGCNRVTCTGCKTQVCWLCGVKLPALNPYSHFTANGCPNVGGGAAHNGGGVPAGAWARVPGAPAAAPILQLYPGPAVAPAALVHKRAVPAAAAVAGPPVGPPAPALQPPPQWDPLPVLRNKRAHRRRRGIYH